MVKHLKVLYYTCQELGTHLSQDFPKPKANQCRRCGQSGHIASSYRGGVESTRRYTQMIRLQHHGKTN